MNSLSIEDLTKENQLLKEKIRELEEKEDQNIYKIFFDNSPDIIILVDASFIFKYVHIPGIPEDRQSKLIGQNFIESTPEVFRDKMRDALKRVFEEQITLTYESEGESLGEYRYYINFMSPIFDDKKNLKHVLIVSRDVSVQKINEFLVNKSAIKLNALFESMNHIFAIFDLDMNILWFNEQANRYSKNTSGTELAINMNVSGFLKDETLENFKKAFSKAKNGELIKYKSNFIIKNGQKLYLEVFLQPIYDKGELVAISNMAVDITDLIDNEENIKKINRELLLQNQQLFQYSHIISHNLRSPIATLMGIVNVIDQFKNDTELIQQLLGQVKSTAQKLDTVIQDLNLILNHTTLDNASRQDIDLTELLESIIELIDLGKKSDVNLTFDFSECPVINSIKGYLHSIMYNLVSNSIKYKKINTPVNINLRCFLVNNDKICLEIKDDGLGIDLEQYGSKIFGFYRRFHNHIEGKGIGLHITKTQVELLEGKISVESEVNKGSIFRIILPKKS